MKIKELLNSEEKWTKKELARDADGNIVYVNSVFAVCWCLVGATDALYPSLPDDIKARNKLGRAICTLFPERCCGEVDSNIVAFNDDPRTTFADVVKVLELADV